MKYKQIKTFIEAIPIICKIIKIIWETIKKTINEENIKTLNALIENQIEMSEMQEEFKKIIGE